MACPLLMRTTRRVAVTEAGKQLLLTLEPGLARIEAGRDSSSETAPYTGWAGQTYGIRSHDS
nr:hypothetical protein [Leclercia sp. 29361]